MKRTPIKPSLHNAAGAKHKAGEHNAGSTHARKGREGHIRAEIPIIPYPQQIIFWRWTDLSASETSPEGRRLNRERPKREQRGGENGTKITKKQNKQKI